ITDTDFNTSVSSMIASIEEMAAVFDGSDVPLMDRHLVMTPEAYRLLVSSGVTTHSIEAAAPSTGANVGMGTIRMFQGFMLHWTNRFADISAVTTAAPGQRGADYGGDFANLAAIALQKEGVGTVKLMDISVETEYLIEYQAHLMLGKYACGHGVLQPSACGAIYTQ
ncbi:MAG TPA: hypothetical protein VMW94_03965, partial [Actinomycetes bacterium]|nr:hypothetical protein [Actinomycetes bacterium]